MGNGLRDSCRCGILADVARVVARRDHHGSVDPALHVRRRFGARSPPGSGCCQHADAEKQLHAANCSKMPLPGLEHVLSIVLCGIGRQIPRNYAASSDRDDIDPRLKTAISNWDAAKTWARMCRSTALSVASREYPQSSAFESKFQHADLEHTAQMAGPSTAYIVHSAKHSGTFNLGSWTARRRDGQGATACATARYIESHGDRDTSRDAQPQWRDSAQG